MYTWILFIYIYVYLNTFVDPCSKLHQTKSYVAMWLKRPWENKSKFKDDLEENHKLYDVAARHPFRKALFV